MGNGALAIGPKLPHPSSTLPFLPDVSDGMSAVSESGNDPSPGFCASLEDAKAKFAETWRAWLAVDTEPAAARGGAGRGGAPAQRPGLARITAIEAMSALGKAEVRPPKDGSGFAE